MFARWIAYKLTDIFYLLKKTQRIFPNDVFDIPDDSVVHHRKARETKLRRSECRRKTYLMPCPTQGLPLLAPVLPVPAFL